MTWPCTLHISFCSCLSRRLPRIFHTNDTTASVVECGELETFLKCLSSCDPGRNHNTFRIHEKQRGTGEIHAQTDYTYSAFNIHPTGVKLFIFLVLALFTNAEKVHKRLLWCHTNLQIDVGYTRGHLHYRVKGHKQQSSAIAKHYKTVHGTMPQDLLKSFQVLKKCKNKVD